uniref:Olfactory receptor n=1 Tax=Anabas testudineus TaxID=64144 RepID=A0A3Q1IRI2_ANATE
MEEFNVTYIILDGHVEVYKYKYLYFMIVFIVYILILCSNSTIVYLIWKHQDLHEPMYIFIAALLLNSVLFSTNIYPKLLIDFLSEKQIITFKACLVQYFMFYTLGNSEFLLLAAMSYDRYVAICKPLQYPTIMSKRTVSVFLTLAWVLPACHVVASATESSNQKLCSSTLKGIFCNSIIYKLFCVASRASFFGLLTLINVVILPVIFIVSSYIRILIICYRSCGEIRKKASQTCLPHLLVLMNLVFLVTYDVITVRLESDFSKTTRLTMTLHLIMTLQLILYNPLLDPIIYGLKMKHLKKLFFQDKMF